MKFFDSARDPESANEYVEQKPSKGDGIFQNLDPSNPQPMPELTRQEQKVYNSLKRIQYLMDDCIKLPCCSRRVGIDPIIGLVPVIGDMGSALVSVFFVARSARVVSRYTIVRMLANVWIDTVVGVVPFAGDIFDVGWKANERNLGIVEDHFKSGSDARSESDRKWLIMVVLGFVVFCTLATIMTLIGVVLLIMFLTGNL